jgi:phosphatidylethanolamine/phosphatidyl-N-methylethanolamine N-methyltransferase
MLKRKWLQKGEVGVALLGVILVSGFAVKRGIEDIFGQGAGTFMVQLAMKPGQVGAFAPCSKYVAQEITRSIKAQPNKKLRILEVGAGTGILTHQIIEDAGQNFHFDVIEINSDFCKTLYEQFGQNKNVHIHAVDILKFVPNQQYDIIISALPFNIFTPQFIKDVLAKYESMIVPGGSLAYVEIRGMVNIKKFFLTKHQIKDLQEKLDIIKVFREKYLEKTVTVFKNLPPIYVHHLKL